MNNLWFIKEASKHRYKFKKSDFVGKKYDRKVDILINTDLEYLPLYLFNLPLSTNITQWLDDKNLISANLSSFVLNYEIRKYLYDRYLLKGAFNGNIVFEKLLQKKTSVYGPLSKKEHSLPSILYNISYDGKEFVLKKTLTSRYIWVAFNYIYTDFEDIICICMKKDYRDEALYNILHGKKSDPSKFIFVYPHRYIENTYIPEYVINEIQNMKYLCEKDKIRVIPQESQILDNLHVDFNVDVTKYFKADDPLESPDVQIKKKLNLLREQVLQL